METPKYTELKGRGCFSSSTYSFSSDFLHLRNPCRIDVLAIIEKQIEIFRLLYSNSNVWQLRGSLQDGRAVKSDSLINTGHTYPPYNVGFSILEGVYIGELNEEPLLKSEFPLINYFEGDISIHHREWEIITSSIPTLKSAQWLSEQWKLPFEGMNLHCSCPGKKQADHLDIARTFMTLASLALGTGVSCHRYILHWPSLGDLHHELETWRFMTYDDLGPGPIIPAFSLSDFI